MLFICKAHALYIVYFTLYIALYKAQIIPLVQKDSKEGKKEERKCYYNKTKKSSKETIEGYVEKKSPLTGP